MGIFGQGAAPVHVRAVAGHSGSQPGGRVLASAKIKGTLPHQARQAGAVHARGKERSRNFLPQMAWGFANYKSGDPGGPGCLRLAGQRAATKWPAIHTGEIPRLTKLSDRQLCRVVVGSS